MRESLSFFISLRLLCSSRSFFLCHELKSSYVRFIRFDPIFIYGRHVHFPNSLSSCALFAIPRVFRFLSISSYLLRNLSCSSLLFIDFSRFFSFSSSFYYASLLLNRSPPPISLIPPPKISAAPVSVTPNASSSLGGVYPLANSLSLSGRGGGSGEADSALLFPSGLYVPLISSTDDIGNKLSALLLCEKPPPLLRPECCRVLTKSYLSNVLPLASYALLFFMTIFLDLSLMVGAKL